jgi:hypothetical protein
MVKTAHLSKQYSLHHQSASMPDSKIAKWKTGNKREKHPHIMEV